VEPIGLVDGARFDGQDLPAAARQVDHPAIADDELNLGDALLAVLERQQVGVAEGAARLQPELRALHDRAEETGLVARREGRRLANLCQRDAREAVGRHVLGQGQCHLLLDAAVGQQGGDGGGRLGAAGGGDVAHGVLAVGD